MSEFETATRDAAGRFQPGASGNPAGRPKGQVSLRETLRDRLANSGVDGRLLRDAILDELLAIALWRRRVPVAVRQRALEFLFDQLEGRARQAVDIDPASRGMGNALFYETMDAIQAALREGPTDEEFERAHGRPKE